MVSSAETVKRLIYGNGVAVVVSGKHVEERETNPGEFVYVRDIQRHIDGEILNVYGLSVRKAGSRYAGVEPALKGNGTLFRVIRHNGGNFVPVENIVLREPVACRFFSRGIGKNRRDGKRSNHHD